MMVRKKDSKNYLEYFSGSPFQILLLVVFNYCIIFDDGLCLPHQKKKLTPSMKINLNLFLIVNKKRFNLISKQLPALQSQQ